LVHVIKIETLTRPAQFKRVRGGVRCAGPLFVIEGRRRSEAGNETGSTDMLSGPRFGFTITRKIGGAVVRNRIRRRLKEAIRGLPPRIVRADHDYVVVASRAAHDYPFAGLQDALREAFERLQERAVGVQGRVRQRKRPAGQRETARSAAKGGVEAVQSAGAEARSKPASEADDSIPGTTPGRR